MDQAQKRKLIESIVILPGTALVLIPGVILYVTGSSGFLFGIKFPLALTPLCVSLLLTAIGVLFAFQTVRLFVTVGEGTPAPWAPPKKFVVRGPYRYVRNPMILSAILVLLGEALLMGSIWILVWTLIFWIGNTVYFKWVEEPGLEKRFGAEYLEYKKHVHRWMPRLMPWRNL